MADPGPPGGGQESPEERAYRRGFRQKSKWDDYALDLFDEARAKLLTDVARVERILLELSRLYNPLVDGPIVDLATRARVLGLLAAGHTAEAESLLDLRYRLYAPLDEPTRRGSTDPQT